jgi:phosphotransferase system enzyme I (PtsP)
VLLMAMGFDILSMNATNLQRVKAMIRDITLGQAQRLLEHALQQEDSEAVETLLEEALQGLGVSRLLQAAREG